MKQVERLQDLSQRIEVLWDFVLQRLELAEKEAQRDLDFFGSPLAPTGNGVGRTEIERKLADENGAYRRLRRVMDAWCALWFWPLTETDVKPPSIDEWIDALTRLLGRSAKDQDYLHPHGSPWEQLNHREDLDLRLNGAEPVEKIFETHPWLKVTERIAAEQGFFHWELDFATVFRRGGFDLQVGNPPWVRPDVDETALLAEYDPWWKMKGPKTATERRVRMQKSFELTPFSTFYVDQHSNLSCTRAFLSSNIRYSSLSGLRTDLYRCFMISSWRHSSADGVVGMIHPETHFIDVKGGAFRSATYRRLRRFWQFDNNADLFADVDDHQKFGVHVYGKASRPSFLMAAALRKPSTLTSSLSHDGSGDLPSRKTADGKWDTRPHSMRISPVNESILREWREILEEAGTPASHSRIVYTINEPSSRAIRSVAHHPRVASLELPFSSGWNETTDKLKGNFSERNGYPEHASQVIIQGRHLGVQTPLSKQPNSPLKSKDDWAPIDLESIAADFIPRTLYKPGSDQGDNLLAYREKYDTWVAPSSFTQSKISALDCYRLSWRSMANLTSMRTLHSAIIPPGYAHPNGVFSLGALNPSQYRDLARVAGITSSLIGDFFIRSTAGSAVSPSLISKLPVPTGNKRLYDELVWRTLRLNCLTSDYAHFYEYVSGDEWSHSRAVRTAEERRQLLVENDAIAAILIGISIDDLCSVYRTQFPVLFHKYDNVDRFDESGRLVPAQILKLTQKRGDETGERLSVEERTWVHPQSQVTYVAAPPFRQLDREADMRAAYAKFAPLMKEAVDE